LETGDWEISDYCKKEKFFENFSGSKAREPFQGEIYCQQVSELRYLLSKIMAIRRLADNARRIKDAGELYIH
jgi:hypothetical protein